MGQGQTGAGAGEDMHPALPDLPHFAPKAKRVIFLFMTGGVSHVDTFDPKPFLNKNHDKPKTKGRRYYKGSGWDFKVFSIEF